MAASRVAYSTPAQQPVAPPAYEADATVADQSPPAVYAETFTPDPAAYPAYYQEYPQESDRNWALIGLGCVLVAIIMVLVVVLVVYFFAPASIVDPIADFLAGLGIDVP
jgi:hypothetical protein